MQNLTLKFIFIFLLIIFSPNWLQSSSIPDEIIQLELSKPREEQQENKRKKIVGFEKLFHFLDKKDSHIYDLFENSPEIYEIIRPYTAFKALDYFYRLCDAWYDYLIKEKVEKDRESTLDSFIS